MNACSGANLCLYIRNRAMFVLVKTRMDEIQKNFWTGVGIGAVIIIIIDLLVPFLGPFIGGFTAGYMARGDLLTAGKAGLTAGILAAIVVFVVVFAGMVSRPASRVGSRGGYRVFLVYRHFPVSGYHRLPWRCYSRICQEIIFFIFLKKKLCPDVPAADTFLLLVCHRINAETK